MAAHRTRRSFLALDAIAAIGLTLVLALAFAAAYRQLAIARHQADARRALRLAAEAELIRLRASGLADLPDAPASQPVRMEIGDITVSTSVLPGQSPWDGLLRVGVTARKLVYGRWTQVELFTYLPARGASP